MLIRCLVIGCLITACADQASSPPIALTPYQAAVKQVNGDQCQSPVEGDFTPLDCYDWGRLPYPGDNASTDYTAIQGWLQATTIDPQAPPDDNAKVEVDYIALLEIAANDQTSIVDIISYDQSGWRPLQRNEGGYFSRWYTDNSFQELSDSQIANGFLEIKVGLRPDLVCHWWMNPSGKYNRKVDCRYQLKCRLRITGPIAVQLAADFYKTINSDYPDNREAFHSGWYGDTGGQFKVFCYPEF